MPHRPRRAEAVIETPLPDELILLDPGTGAMFSLNATGRFIWQRLGEQSPDGIAAEMAATFGITRARADADVRALLADLARAGLVEAGRAGDA